MPFTLEQNAQLQYIQTALKTSYAAHNTLPGILDEPNQPIESYFVDLILLERDAESEPAMNCLLTREEELLDYKRTRIPAQSLPLHQLFSNAQGELLKRQVLVGAAGTGKSALCQYIAWCWSQPDLSDDKQALGEWQPYFDWVFRLTLKHIASYTQRYPEVRNPLSILAGLVYEETLDATGHQTLIRENLDREATIDLLTLLLRNAITNPENIGCRILWLADGADEIMHHLNEPRSSLISTLEQLLLLNQYHLLLWNVETSYVSPLGKVNREVNR